jgi:putative protein-disulfide isomerase
MTAPTLHYVHDPLCGWCYAVTPMIEAVAQAGIGIAVTGADCRAVRFRVQLFG